MGLHSFLERLGFVRLRDFGLILTPDRRIVTTREVLDDGYGATVVGWEDSDLAAAELAKKRRATTNGGANVAFRPLPPPPPTLPTKLGVVKKVTAPMLALAPVAPITPPAPAAIPAPVVAAKSNVIARPAGANPFTSNTVAYPSSKSDSSQFAATEIAAMPTFVPSGDDEDFVKEDEWEWQIAKARAQSDDKTPTPVKAAPVNPFAKEPRQAAIHRVQVVATSTPRTIIPVPSLPAAVDARRVLDAFHPPAVPRRMARGTRPVNDEDTSTSLRAIPARR